MPEQLSLSLSFTADSFPEGWSGGYNEFAQALAERLHAYGSGNFLQGVSGGAEPTSNQGLYLNDVGNADGTSQLSAWSETQSKYLPIYTTPVGTLILSAVNYAPETVGEAEPNFLVCNGHEYLVGEFPQLYSKIGILWGGTLGTSFKVPDFRGRVPIGAGTGVDYISGSKSLITRIIGALEGYVGHDFISNQKRPTNPPSAPALQLATLSAPTANMSSITQAGVVCSVLIRVR